MKTIKEEEASLQKVEDTPKQEPIVLREVEILSDDYIIDDETYFADKKYVTNSMLKNLLTGSTLDINHYLNAERSETESLIVGSAFHCLLLEPEEFNKRYVYEPKFDKRTKVGKEAYAEFEKTLDGKKPVPEKYEDIFTSMLMNLRTHKAAQSLLASTKNKEVIHFFKDKKTGLECKGKVDAEGDDFIIDVKTTSKGVDMKSFQKFANDYHLTQQAAFYCNATAKKHFFFVMFQLKAPYNIAVYKMSNNAINFGNYYVDTTLSLYKEWKDSGESYIQHVNGGEIVVI
tara:strand:- start:4727 stop:5587 length:861 start_codon:yes stop_codon:yes gene_type:complete